VKSASNSLSSAACMCDKNVVKPADTKMLELKDEHWQLMNDLLLALQPLQVATYVMCIENSPSASTLHPMLWVLINNHLQPNDDDSLTVATFKHAMTNAIKRHFGMSDTSTTRNVCVVASVLDQCFRQLPGTLLHIYHTYCSSSLFSSVNECKNV